MTAADAVKILREGWYFIVALIALGLAIAAFDLINLRDARAQLASFEAAPGCDVASEADTTTGSPCTWSTAAIIGLHERYHGRSGPYTYDTTLTVREQTFHSVGIGYDFFENHSLHDTVDAELWNNTVVSVSDNYGLTHTSDNPRVNLTDVTRGAFRDTLLGIIIGGAVIFTLWVAKLNNDILIRAPAAFSRTPASASTPQDSREPLDFDGAVGPHTHAGEAPPAAMGDDAGLNQSDMWK